MKRETRDDGIPQWIKDLTPEEKDALIAEEERKMDAAMRKNKK